jgi:opacity protein-like surface antigen
MHGMMRAACLAAVVSTIAVPGLAAQSRAGVGVASERSSSQTLFRMTAKRASLGLKAPAVQDAGSGTTFTILGGIATGDEWDLGFVLGGTATFHPAGMPIAIRIDPYVARHGGGDEFTIGTETFGDASLLILGVAGNVEWTIPTSSAFAAQGGSSSMAPYLLGGLGIYRGSVDIDIPGNIEFDDSSTDIGFGIGGGLRFGGNFGVEARLLIIDEMTTLPIRATWRF